MLESQNIYENLATEDWIYRNMQFKVYTLQTHNTLLIKMDHYFWPKFAKLDPTGPDSVSRVKLLSQVRPKTSINLPGLAGLVVDARVLAN